MKNSYQFKKINGFWKFAFFPVQLISGETVWLKKYFVAGSRFGGINRFAVGHQKFEIRYSRESARLAGN